jgi:hypothetical protein
MLLSKMVVLQMVLFVNLVLGDKLPKAKEKKGNGLGMSPKLKKPKKGGLVKFLANSMTEEQWDLISQLRGQPTPPTQGKKENYLNGLFRKTRSHSTAKGIGRSLQQWLAAKISGFTGVAHGKDEEIESRPMGQSGPDVFLSKRVRKMFPFTAECKSGNQWGLPAAIKQCQANLYPDTHWLVCLDRPHARPEERIPPIVVVDGEVFFKILARTPTGDLEDL